MSTAAAALSQSRPALRARSPRVQRYRYRHCSSARSGSSFFWRHHGFVRLRPAEDRASGKFTGVGEFHEKGCGYFDQSARKS